MFVDRKAFPGPPSEISVRGYDGFINSHFVRPEDPTAWVTATQLRDGIVHHTFALRSIPMEPDQQARSAILKVRGNTWSQRPETKINPADIQYEAMAIERTHRASPQEFPELLGFDPNGAAILMTDVNPSKNSLEGLFDKGIITPVIMRRVGETLGRAHKNLRDRGGRKPIRSDGDKDKYEDVLEQRGGTKGLEHLREELQSQQEQLVHGDLWAKNVGVNDGNNGETGEGKVVFIDLENVHQGNPLFETAIFTGQTILHAIDDPNSAEKNTSALLQGYASSQDAVDVTEPRFRMFAVGIIIEELATTQASYPTFQIENTLVNMERLLRSGDPKWTEIFEGLRTGDQVDYHSFMYMLRNRKGIKPVR